MRPGSGGIADLGPPSGALALGIRCGVSFWWETHISGIMGFMQAIQYE